MKSFGSISLIWSAALLLGTNTAVLRAAENQLPKADEVLERYVAATGGREAYDKITNRVMKGTMEIAGQGLKLSITVYAAKPNLVYSVLDSDVTGKIESGTDGNVVWENSLLKGPAIKSGTERLNALRDFTFDRFPYWRKIYGKAECVALEPVNDEECFKVVLSPKPVKSDEGKTVTGEPLTLFIEKTTGLLVKLESKVVSEAGTIPVEAYFKDYREVNGLKIPFKLLTKVLGQERNITIQTIEQNLKLAEDRFELPEPVRALADKAKTDL